MGISLTPEYNPDSSFPSVVDPSSANPGDVDVYDISFL